MTDKRRIMELLLWKEDVLTKVLIKIFRKIKIKDIERKYELEQKQSKYRVMSSDGTNSSVRNTRINQRTNNQFNESMGHSKSPMSFNADNRNSMIQYEAPPPTHMLNQEIKGLDQAM